MEDSVFSTSWETICETTISPEKIDEWSWSDISQGNGLESDTGNVDESAVEKVVENTEDEHDDLFVSIFSFTISLIMTLILMRVHGQFDSSRDHHALEGDKFRFCEASMAWTFDPYTQIISPDQSTQMEAFMVYGMTNILRIQVDQSELCSSDNGKKILNHYEYFDIIFEEPKAHLLDTGMSIDSTNGNLYVIDKTTESIVVIDIHSKKYNFLLTGLDNPLQVLLDSEIGVMFVLQKNHLILRGGMDGSNMREIIKCTYEISSVTLDKLNQRIYWIKNKVAIQSSDYDGKDVKTVVKDSEDEITIMTISGGWMFWLWRDHSMERPVLWYRQLIDDSASFDRAILPFGLFNDIRSVGLGTVVQQRVHTFTNQSNLENLTRYCEELRLASPLGKGYRCACALGRRLNPDGKTCRSVSDFMLFTTANLVRGIQLEQPHADVFWPTPYQAELRRKSSIDFDYDLFNDVFYYSDDLHIYRMKLKSYNGTEVMITTEIGSDNWPEYFVNDLAYDWVGGKLYYSLCNSAQYGVLRSSLKSSGTGVIDETSGYLFIVSQDGEGCSNAFALNPIKKHLVFTGKDDSLDYFISPDCSKDMKVSQTNFVPIFPWLTIDAETGRVYWIADEHIIEHMNPDGSDRRSLHYSKVPNATAVSVHRQWIYLSADNNIRRVRKSDGSSVENLIGPTTGRIGKIKIVSPVIQQTIHNV